MTESRYGHGSELLREVENKIIRGEEFKELRGQVSEESPYIGTATG